MAMASADEDPPVIMMAPSLLDHLLGAEARATSAFGLRVALT